MLLISRVSCRKVRRDSAELLKWLQFNCCLSISILIFQVTRILSSFKNLIVLNRGLILFSQRRNTPLRICKYSHEVGISTCSLRRRRFTCCFHHRLIELTLTSLHTQHHVVLFSFLLRSLSCINSKWNLLRMILSDVRVSFSRYFYRSVKIFSLRNMMDVVVMADSNRVVSVIIR